MLIDVIIPVYNPGKYLEDCLESCLAQSYQGKYKITIVDDGSTEDLSPILKKYKGYFELISLKKNRGVSAARNRAIQETSGEILCFQDADDVMHKDRLALTVERFLKEPDKVMVCGNYRFAIEGKLSPLCFTTPPELYFATLLVHFPIHASTVALKRFALDRVGLFDESLPIGEDYDLWIRILKEFPNDIAYIHEELAHYTWCETESSLTKKYRGTKEHDAILRSLSEKYQVL